MRAAKHFVIGIIAVLALSGILSSRAFASHKHHPPKSPKYRYKPDKNAYLFGGKYKAPKKQHVPRSLIAGLIATRKPAKPYTKVECRWPSKPVSCDSLLG